MTTGTDERPVRGRVGRGLAIASSAFLLACGGQVPLPRLPQVEQASEVVQGERASRHRTCVGKSEGTEQLIECMRAYGYEYVARGPEYPAAECWRIRESPRPDRLPEAFCFLKQRQ